MNSSPTSDPAPAPKVFFKSRTILLNLVIAAAGVVAVFHPGAQEVVQQHAAGLLEVIGLINILLRSITHGRVALVSETSPDGL